MPKFTELDPSEVLLGRGRSAMEERRPYREAVEASLAGRIDLERGDNPDRVKRLLRLAARDAGLAVRSSWADGSQRVLLWKRSAGSRVRRRRTTRARRA